MAETGSHAPEPLHPDLMRRARLARDARFDGRFFIGVRTTGVYCRPVCPVLPPKEANVRYYPSAAAAAEAGFRPCLRCRPEAAPGSPASAGTSATVSRAVRLIEEGALDRGSVASLATRLGVGARHLTRLFRTHLGASPGAVARTRRLHFAKRLIDGSELPMTEVAVAAGYGSVRRFNEDIARTYGRSPRSLRTLRRRGTTDAAASTLTLSLAARPPFDAQSVLDFLGRRRIPGVESVEGGCYRRTIRVAGAEGVLEIRAPEAKLRNASPGIEVRVRWAEPCFLLPLVERARRLFDLAADWNGIAEVLSRDPALAPHLCRWPGLRLPGAWDGFETGVRAILGQQVSLQGASTLTARFVVRYGEEAMGGDQELRRHFPAAEAIAGCRHLVLGADGGGGGLPAARGRAILGLARAVAEGGICFDGSMDPGTLRTRLLAIPGVGPWTAEYVAMRALGDPDALPAGDLVLRRALAPRGGVPPTAAQVRRRAEAWRPWRSYALMLLWRDAQTRREPLARGGRRTPHGRRKEEASWSSRTSTVRSVPS